MGSFYEQKGIDNTVLLLFGALVLIAFILLSAAGMRAVEEDAQDVTNGAQRAVPGDTDRNRNSQSNIDFGS
jgi:hypothetical protein